MARFVVIQPGCDMFMDDVFEVDFQGKESENPRLMYVAERGVPYDFFKEAQIGDVCFFDRERVIIRVGRRYVRGQGWEE